MLYNTRLLKILSDSTQVWKKIIKRIEFKSLVDTSTKNNLVFLLATVT